MEKWALEEAEFSSKFVLLTEYPSHLTCLYFVWKAYTQQGLVSGDTVALIGLYCLMWYYFQRLKAIRKTVVRFWIVFALYQIGQVSMLYRVRVDEHESLAVSVICSTAILMIGEISPVHSLRLNALLVTKHIALWTVVAWSKGVPGEGFSIVMALWCMWLLLFAQEHKRKLLVAKQKAEEAKSVEEQRLKALLSAMPDGVIVLSHTLHLLTHNPAALQQFHLHTQADLHSFIHQLKYDPEYLEGEHSFGEDLGQLVQQEVGRTKSFKPVLCEGRHLECRGCVAKWDEGKVLVLIVRDTTNWARLEKAAKQESANKTALIRSVSHELRTPVNAILNLCQDLQSSETIGVREREDIEVLANASTFLLSMINDLLDYSRILHDKFDLVRTNCDLEHLIRTCGQLIALQCKQKQVQFIIRVDSLLPTLAYTDENRLKQVILNLLSNAAKFTVKGSVTLIAMLSRSGQLQVSVEDTGIGIPPDKLQSIFTMFGKLDSCDLNPQGCGLGLSISSMLVTRLGGGTIEVLSEPQKGSTFSFQVPISSETLVSDFSITADFAEENAEIPSERVPFQEWPLAISSLSVPQAQVLIVDDAPFNRLVLRKILEAAGYSFAEASTGLEAVNTIRAAYDRGSPFLVVLMDVEMPEMDGITATRELLRLVGTGELGSVPVIVGCSAFSSEEDRAAALAAGMSHYLEKPVSRARVLELVSAHTNR